MPGSEILTAAGQQRLILISQNSTTGYEKDYQGTKSNLG
jgi:hypothetical protein